MSRTTSKTRVKSDNKLDELFESSERIMREAVEEATKDGHKIVATVALYSGGNDSTTMAHMFARGHFADTPFRVTHAAHANTSIGIEETRQFVRDTCKSWDLKLIEKYCEPGKTYEDLVLGKVFAYPRPGSPRYKPENGLEQHREQIWSGFPSPPGHKIMYNMLKERAMNKVRSDLVKHPSRERVLYITGIRRDESQRRAKRPAVQRKGSAVWVSPLIEWTALDLNAYRFKYLHTDLEVPRNPVAELLHMSGECLCGAFGHEGELDEIARHFPEVAEKIRALQDKVKAASLRGDFLQDRTPSCLWGFDARKPGESPLTSESGGPMCAGCDTRAEMEERPKEEQFAETERWIAEGGTPVVG